jgi:hypothetical protein
MRQRESSNGKAELAAIRAELKRLVEKRLNEEFTLEERNLYRDLLDRENELLLRP